MKKLSTWIYKNATWKKSIFLGLITIIIILSLFPFLSLRYSSTDLPLQLLDTNMNYTPQQAIDHVSTLTDQERTGNIKLTLIADTIYPILYALTFSFILSLQFKNYADTTSIIKYINLLPFLAMLSDLTENFAIITLIRSYPNLSQNAATIASFATPAKWGFILIILLCIAYRFSYLRAQKRRLAQNITQKRN